MLTNKGGICDVNGCKMCVHAAAEKSASVKGGKGVIEADDAFVEEGVLKT